MDNLVFTMCRLFCLILLCIATTQLVPVTARQPFIIAGRVAQPIIDGTTRFPFMALILYDKFNNGDHQVSCGGTLYNSSVIITAGHCIVDTLSKYIVVLGEHNRTTNEGTEKNYTISRVITYPYPEADLALAFLSEPVQQTPEIQSISALSDIAPAPGLNVTGIGWGQTETDRVRVKPADVLQELTLPIQSREECEGEIPGFQNMFNYFCGGFNPDSNNSRQNYSNTCSGDSGGPILLKANSTELQLIGVISGGHRRCPRDKFYAYYASIPHLAPWIQQTLASAPTDFFLVSVNSGIYRTDSLTGNTRRVSLETSPRGITFNSVDNRVTWFASRYGLVGSATLNATGKLNATEQINATERRIEAVPRDGSVVSMAFDALNKTIYYSVNGKIKSYNVDSHVTTHVINGSVFKRGQISLNTRTRKLYYIVRSVHSETMLMNNVEEYDLTKGSVRRVFSVKAARDDYIQGLAVSETGDVMYACLVIRRHDGLKSRYYKYDMQKGGFPKPIKHPVQRQKCLRLAWGGKELFILDEFKGQVLVVNWLDLNKSQVLATFNNVVRDFAFVRQV